MRVVWTEHAMHRLGQIYDYIHNDSPVVAAQVCSRLIDATEQLETHPYSGPMLPEDGAYRQLTVDAYRLVYRVAEDTVYIMTIVAPGMLIEHAL